VSDAEVTTIPPAGDVPAVIRVVGELDLASVPHVQAAFAAVEADEPDAIAMDLGEVTHLDSTGLRVLLDGARRSTGAGRRFIVVAPPGGRSARSCGSRSCWSTWTWCPTCGRPPPDPEARGARRSRDARGG